MATTDPDGPNLAMVDRAFGSKSDLYRDVLRVNNFATNDQIHNAYFVRRDEIFHLLSEVEEQSTERVKYERQMDALVSAVRILGDPDLRLEYDDLRSERLKSNKKSVSPKRSPRRSPPPQSSSRSQRRDDADTTTSRQSIPALKSSIMSEGTTTVSSLYNPTLYGEEEEDETTLTMDASLRSPAEGKFTYKYAEDESTLGSDTFYTEADENATMYTTGSISESILQKTSRKPKGFLDQVRIEVIGAIDDTSRTLNQVLNVFTLQEEDIKAVMGRIDKAKRQMSQSMIVPQSPPQREIKIQASSSSSHRKSRSHRKKSSRK